MIRIQPKPGFHSGSAVIPIGVIKKCSPTGMDCSEVLEASHEYHNCFDPSLPVFSITKRAAYKTTSEPKTLEYGLTIQNTGDQKNTTTLTDTLTKGSQGGTLELYSFNIEECPPEARCMIVSVTNTQLKILLTDVPPDGVVKITYGIRINTDEIPANEVSYFTNTATLSPGGTAQIIEGISGTNTGPGGEPTPTPRPERPRQQ